MSQPIRGQGGHLVFPTGLKNTNLVEDVEKMSQPIRGQGGHLVFLIGPENTNLVRGSTLLILEVKVTMDIYGNKHSESIAKAVQAPYRRTDSEQTKSPRGKPVGD